MDLIKITPDKEKARSLVDTANVRLDAILLFTKTNREKYSSKIVEEYYETVLEFISSLMFIDGYKTRSDLVGSHLAVIEYLRTHYKKFSENEIELIDDLRKKRIGIKYYGKHVNTNYLDSNENSIKEIVKKLSETNKSKLK